MTSQSRPSLGHNGKSVIDDPLTLSLRRVEELDDGMWTVMF